MFKHLLPCGHLLSPPEGGFSRQGEGLFAPAMQPHSLLMIPFCPVYDL